MKSFLTTVMMILCIVLTVSSAVADMPVQSAGSVDLSNYSVSTGNIVGVDYVDIVAPWSGVLKPFDIQIGDDVEAGDNLFEMLQTDIVAPDSGTVSAIFADRGDNSLSAISVHGCLVAITPSKYIRIICTYNGGYNSDENKIAHIGEHVFLKSNNNDKSESEGIVIAANEKGFVVEVTGAPLKLAQTINVYRNAMMTKEKCIGTGITSPRSDITIPVMSEATLSEPSSSMPLTSGIITEIVAPLGTKVSKGDVILRISGPDADKDASALISSPISGTVTQLAVQPGQQVWKGQLLARIYDKTNLEILTEMDEVDLKNIKIGDRLPVTLDAYPSDVFYGVVTKISSVGIKKQNASYYNVHIKLEDLYPVTKPYITDNTLPENNFTYRIGQTASVYTYNGGYTTLQEQLPINTAKQQ